MAFITTGEGNLTQTLATEDWLVNQHLSGRLYGAGNSSYNGLGGSQYNTMTQVGSATNWGRLMEGTSSTSIFAFDASDNLYGWGLNSVNYKLGVGNTTSFYYSPTSVSATGDWKKVYGSGLGGIALKRDGSLWRWGQTASGSITTPTQLGTGKNWVDIAQFSSVNTQFALDTDGQVWYIGDSAWYSGYSGSNITTLTKVSIEGENLGIAKIATGDQHALLMLTSEGRLYATKSTSGEPILPAGDEYARYLPDGEPTWKNSLYKTNHFIFPRSTVDMRFRDIRVAGYQFGNEQTTGSWMVLALDLQGRLWTVGNSANFSITTSGTAWSQVGTASDWKQISIGFRHFAAIKEDGSLWTWGNNASGQLGLGDTTTRTAPTRVGSENYWKDVVASYDVTHAMTYY